jgi:hypothetical protein
VSTSERGSGSRRATEPSSSHDVRLGTASSPMSVRSISRSITASITAESNAAMCITETPVS